MMIHAVIVAITGTIGLGTLFLALLLKGIGLVSFLICPLQILWLKKKMITAEEY